MRYLSAAKSIHGAQNSKEIFIEDEEIRDMITVEGYCRKRFFLHFFFCF